jgi:hypothetical protein
MVDGNWQSMESAPRDGTWILLRGLNAVGAPMIPVVCAWRDGAWRDSASLREMTSLIADVPPGHEADWLTLPDTRPNTPTEDVVERVAEAICDSMHRNDPRWSALSEEVREHWRIYARAAIEALGG